MQFIASCLLGGGETSVCVCVFTSFPYRETLSAAKTVAVLANSCHRVGKRL